METHDQPAASPCAWSHRLDNRGTPEPAKMSIRNSSGDNQLLGVRPNYFFTGQAVLVSYIFVEFKNSSFSGTGQ